MILFRKYSEKEKIDKIWYQSSNIVYSECLDNDNDYKTLIVVFKGGATYQYNNVDVQDYVMFVHGGLDGSNGKALNSFIKKKCEYVKLPNRNLEELQKELEELESHINNGEYSKESNAEPEEENTKENSES